MAFSVRAQVRQRCDVRVEPVQSSSVPSGCAKCEVFEACVDWKLPSIMDRARTLALRTRVSPLLSRLGTL
jgi:hypothetical protein